MSPTTANPASSAFPRAAPPCRGRAIPRGSSSASSATARSAGYRGRSGRIGARREGSVRFRARQLDHLGPLLGFGREQLGEIGGRAGQRRAAPLGGPCLHPPGGKGSVGLAGGRPRGVGRGAARGRAGARTTPPP